LLRPLQVVHLLRVPLRHLARLLLMLVLELLGLLVVGCLFP
jgi:hypothetical protein